MTNSIIVNSPTTNSSNSTPSSSRPVLSRLHLKTEKARRKLHEFVLQAWPLLDRKSTRLNSSHLGISYAVFCLKKKKHHMRHQNIAVDLDPCTNAVVAPDWA